MNKFYPQLPEAILEVVLKNYENDAQYFDDPACPYKNTTKELFKGISKVHDFQTHEEDLEESVKAADTQTILQTLCKVQKELDNYGEQVKSQGDSGMNTYFRLRVSILDKLVSLKERANRIDSFESLVATIIEIMEKELDVDQRARVTQRIQELAKGDME